MGRQLQFVFSPVHYHTDQEQTHLIIIPLIISESATDFLMQNPLYLYHWIPLPYVSTCQLLVT